MTLAGSSIGILMGVTIPNLEMAVSLAGAVLLP